jgi:hypothetical protein
MWVIGFMNDDVCTLEVLETPNPHSNIHPKSSALHPLNSQGIRVLEFGREG